MMKWIKYAALFVAFTTAFAVADVTVSVGLGWQGAYALFTSGEAQGDRAASKDGATVEAPSEQEAAANRAAKKASRGKGGILVLVGLAVGMYLFASHAMAESVLALGERPSSLSGDALNALSQALRTVSGGAPATDPSSLAQRPIDDHRRLASSLGTTTPSAAGAILSRLGPRDLLGMESLEQALSAGVQSRWRRAIGAADHVDNIGQMAAVAGLSTTAAALIVAGTDLSSAEHAGLALSGALLKCFVGLFARFWCLATQTSVYRSARCEEEEILGLIRPATQPRGVT